MNIYTTQMVDHFFLMSSVLLAIALAILHAIPSGPQCPDCEGHLTERFKLQAIRKSDSKPVIIEWTSCFRCKQKFDRSINGRKTNTFTDIED
jgi:hypothetical protein